MRQANKIFQRPDVSPLHFREVWLRQGPLRALQLAEQPQTELQFIVDILGHQGDLLDDFLLVAKFPEGGLQFLIQLFEPGLQLAAAGAGRRALQLVVTLIYRQVELANVLDQCAQRPDMALPALDLLVEDYAVETLFGRLGSQFFRQGNVFLAGETKAADDSPDLIVRAFDAL